MKNDGAEAFNALNCKASISVILPVRNEEMYIGECLDSIVGQTIPKDLLEILVIDGCSSDSTPEIVKSFSKKYDYIQLFRNPEKNTIAALNLGIRKAAGDIIIRVDGHVCLEKNYIEMCIKALTRSAVDNAGGAMRPVGTTYVQKAIALATTSVFGIGWGAFHYSDKEEFVDTVYLGAFRKSLVEKIGYFDPDMEFNEDNEFNLRILENGGKILLSPQIRSTYIIRGSLKELWHKYFNYGHYKLRVIKKHKMAVSLRHGIPPLLVGSLMISALFSTVNSLFAWVFCWIAGSYLAVSLTCSLLISLQLGIRYSLILPLVFATLHFSYGIGYLTGVWTLLFCRMKSR